MCYCKCQYEDYWGDCQKPDTMPCPYDEKSVQAYERWLDWSIDREKDLEMGRENA